MKKFRANLIGAYIALAILTLVFQIHVRSGQCAGAGSCAVSYGKAAVWSVIWPVNWVLYLKGPS